MSYLRLKNKYTWKKIETSQLKNNKAWQIKLNSKILGGEWGRMEQGEQWDSKHSRKTNSGMKSICLCHKNQQMNQVHLLVKYTSILYTSTGIVSTLLVVTNFL